MKSARTNKAQNAKISSLLKRGQTLVFAKPPDSVGAIEAFHSVTEMGPNWIEGFHWLGSALEQRGRLEDAIKRFRKAVQLDINVSRPLISSGICFFKLGRFVEAISSFRSGLALKPHYGETDARLLLANALERNGDVKDAITEWKKVAAMKGMYPSHDLPVNEAKLRLAERGFKEG